VSLFDADDNHKALNWRAGEYPMRGNAVIGTQPSDPRFIIEARGAHDLIYLPERLKKRDARRETLLVVDMLLQHDYTAGLFVNEQRVGRVRGALPISVLGWESRSASKLPDVVASFGSRSAGCDRLLICTLQISDTPLQEGRDVLGAFSRADTYNFMAARGPDFRRRFVNRAPASNADVVATIAELLGLQLPNANVANGRVLRESFRGREGEAEPQVRTYVLLSKRSRDGYLTEAHLQAVGTTQYFEAAGFPGWTVGIEARPEPFDWRFWRWDWPIPKSVTIRPW
jgi:hypothetical protein